MSEPNTQPTPETEPTPPQGTPLAQSFDYDKLASIITGKQSVAEDTVLKSYFKEQGLSADEMKQAINAFKEQKAKNTPNVSALQNDLTAEKSARLQAEINQSATLEAIKQGVDVNSIPYVLKMADYSEVAPDGKLNSEKLTEAVKKVLDDVPALKGSSNGDNNGGWGERHKGSPENTTGVEDAFFKRNPDLKN